VRERERERKKREGEDLIQIFSICVESALKSEMLFEYSDI
jgi:hypothetical protein